METIKATEPTLLNQKWEFTQLDLNCLKLIIKGMWIFDYYIDEKQFKKSIGILLNHYPHLAGRSINNQFILMNNEGITFEFINHQKLRIEDIQKVNNPLDVFNSKFNLKNFLKGSDAPVNIRLTHLSNGSVINIHCAHVCMDGHAFFTMMANLSKTMSNQPIEKPLLSSKSKIFSDIISKQDAMKIVEEKKWHQLGIKNLFQLVWQSFIKTTEHVTPPIYISNEYIQSLKDSIEKLQGKKYGTHVILSSLITQICINLNKFNKATKYSQITVVDIRGRIKEIDENYVGNAVANIPVHEFSSNLNFEDLCDIIDTSLKSMLENSYQFEEYIKLNIATAKYKLPYISFDLNGMSAKHPTCLYINNLLKFPVYELDFGNGNPVVALPNDLPDAIKIWPSSPKNPGINIFFRGNFAKMYNRLNNKEKWLTELLNDFINRIN